MYLDVESNIYWYQSYEPVITDDSDYVGLNLETNSIEKIIKGNSKMLFESDFQPFDGHVCIGNPFMVFIPFPSSALYTRSRIIFPLNYDPEGYEFLTRLVGFRIFTLRVESEPSIRTPILIAWLFWTTLSGLGFFNSLVVIIRNRKILAHALYLSHNKK